MHVVYRIRWEWVLAAVGLGHVADGCPGGGGGGSGY